MKRLIVLLLLLSASTYLSAQTLPANYVPRRIQMRTIGQDSIDLALNEDYDLIEDSCSVIVRHAHINLRERKFFGKFTDVSKLDPSVVLSEGNYTTAGLKDGVFISHYINGNLRSKGVYKNDKYDGRWESYYDNNKPAMVFEAVNDTVRIINVWGTDGKKIIDNGKGTYVINLGSISWKGKLDNGRPDGLWNVYKTDDVTQTSLVIELFKKGKFQKGKNATQNYTDASRIVLVNPDAFPFARAEKMYISPVPCNGTKSKHIVNAQYSNGLATFSQYISDLVTPVISKINIKSFENQLTLEGQVSENGNIINLKTPDAFNLELAQAITRALHSLPSLQPATADGKPVKQSFTITFVFSNGSYRYTYRFLPIKAN